MVERALTDAHRLDLGMNLGGGRIPRVAWTIQPGRVGAIWLTLTHAHGLEPGMNLGDGRIPRVAWTIGQGRRRWLRER
jgi:hypothetical protein